MPTAFCVGMLKRRMLPLREVAMSIRRVVPNIETARLAESRRFYVELFGFQVAMDMEWIVTLASPINQTAQISLVRSQATKPPAGPLNPSTAGSSATQLSLTIEVADVDAVHGRALELGVPIIYPLTNEPWGVRRFHVSDPNGVVLNIMCHLAEKKRP